LLLHELSEVHSGLLPPDEELEPDELGGADGFHLRPSHERAFCFPASHVRATTPHDVTVFADS
jgi:hypothetical protein